MTEPAQDYNQPAPETWGRAWMTDPPGGALGALWDDLIAAFRARTRLGSPAPDFTGELLDGSTFSLSSWRGRKAVLLVFGSITCPPCVSNIRAARPSLVSLYDRHRDAVEFCYVYTREGHPGRKIGPHASMDEKRANARRLRELEAFDFPLVVDDLAGTIHRTYSDPRFNNPVFLVSAAGLVTYKSAWLDASELPQVLEDQRLWDARAATDRTIKKSFSERIRVLREPFDPDGKARIARLMEMVGLSQDEIGPVPGIGTESLEPKP